MARQSTFRSKTTYADIQGDGRYPVTLDYDAADPLAVTLNIYDRGAAPSMGADPSISWIFARSLLIDALLGNPGGDGDVHVQMEAGRLRIDLRVHSVARNESGTLLLDADPVSQFLARTLAIVSRAAEEAVVSWLIDEAWPDAQAR